MKRITLSLFAAAALLVSAAALPAMADDNSPSTDGSHLEFRSFNNGGHGLIFMYVRVYDTTYALSGTQKSQTRLVLKSVPQGGHPAILMYTRE
jgi:hypothetical protein